MSDKTEQTEKTGNAKRTETVDAKSLDRLSGLLGAFDENLNFLTRALGVDAYVEGVKIRFSGASEQVSTAVRAIRALLTVVDAGEEIGESRLLYCIELAKEGKEEQISSLGEGVVAVTARGKQIKCKTLGQKQYVEAIKKNSVTFGVGPAGTGKTYLAVCLAVAAFKSKQVEKIVLTRPAVEAGEKLGFLPGDLQEKVDPYLRPLYDALQEMLGLETYAKLMERGAIEVAPLAYMRGRTLSNAFIILDEAQNTTREQMKMFLTRMGEGSKTVVTGDITQIDLDGKESGLLHATKVLGGVEGISVCRLTAKDVVRHPLVMRIVRAYEQAAEKEKSQETEEKAARKTPRKE
ncbi:MAG: PhoH family protein [Clostridia bacterium]|nr:PhoH family protein [Clostridia bacterium]